MRIVYYGSGEFGLPTLRAILAVGHAVVAAVTQPDRPAGRGRENRRTPVKEFALENGIPVRQPELPSHPDEVERLKKQGGTYMIKSQKLLFPITNKELALATLQQLLTSLTEQEEEEGSCNE